MAEIVDQNVPHDKQPEVPAGACHLHISLVAPAGSPQSIVLRGSLEELQTIMMELKRQSQQLSG